MSESTTKQRGVRKQREGIVVSRSGDKSIVVVVERRTQHPLYGKTIRTKKKFHTHDEKNEAGVGDKVRIVETRPVSRLKRWRLESVLHKGVGSV
ncbi:MAG: 30S ribosomal protein S17 [Lentisphaerae bacterium]|nr:30S ribosomal protein S17 [Lentisphaerota bacterium]